MKKLLKTFSAMVLATSVSGVAVGGFAAVAGASTTPPWEPDTAAVGGLTFFDSSGNQITGGSLDAPFAAYVQGATIRSGDTKATLFAYTPVSSKAPGAWSGQTLSSSTTYPNSQAPSALATSSLPLVTGATSDVSLSTYISNFPNNDSSSDGYANLYVLRLKTSAKGLPTTAGYDEADIEVTGSSWHVVYPAPTLTSTTTSLSASPTSPQVAGTSITLTATVSPAETGSVQFYVGATPIGTAQTVVAGSASVITSDLPQGTDGLSAVFTPTTYSAVAASTGTATFVVNPAHTVPGSPTNVLATAGNASATVSWTDPASDGNSTIQSYTATSSPGSFTCNATGASATSCVVNGLANGTAYTFTVVATNGVGSSSPSTASTAVTPSTVPGAPAITTVTGGNASATVQFTAPASNGGAAILGYTVTSAPGAFTCTTTGPLGSSCTVNGLSNGTAYTFTVAAQNTNGFGTSSSASSPVTPATVPGAPTGVALSVPSNGSLSVSWTAPASTGGAAISGYTATATSGGTSKTCTTATTSCTISGLTSTSAYSVSVVASNLKGESNSANYAVSAYPVTATSVSALSLVPVAQKGVSFGVLVYGVSPGSSVSVKNGTKTINGVANALGEFVANTSVAKTGVFSIVTTAGKKSVTTKVFAPLITVPTKAKHGGTLAITIASAPPKVSASASASNSKSATATTSASGTATLKVSVPKAGTVTVTVTIAGVSFPANSVSVS